MYEVVATEVMNLCVGLVIKSWLTGHCLQKSVSSESACKEKWLHSVKQDLISCCCQIITDLLCKTAENILNRNQYRDQSDRIEQEEDHWPKRFRQSQKLGIGFFTQCILKWNVAALKIDLLWNFIEWERLFLLCRLEWFCVSRFYLWMNVQNLYVKLSLDDKLHCLSCQASFTCFSNICSFGFYFKIYLNQDF